MVAAAQPQAARQGDTAPRAGYCPSPTRAPGPWSWATAQPLGKLELLYQPCCPPFRRPPGADPGARGRPSVPARADPAPPPGTAPGPPTRRHSTEAGLQATPARPRAPKPSRWNDQRPRSWPLRLGAASSPRRARSQSPAEPDAPHGAAEGRHRYRLAKAGARVRPKAPGRRAGPAQFSPSFFHARVAPRL